MLQSKKERNREHFSAANISNFPYILVLRKNTHLKKKCQMSGMLCFKTRSTMTSFPIASCTMVNDNTSAIFVKYPRRFVLLNSLRL